MRQVINHEQGSAAWHQHRREHFNASDAPAMLGCSPYKTRQALLHEVATGIVDAEIDAGTARRFADGHRFEALARPLAEQIIGEELAPLVLADGKYSASFDGLTFVGDVAFEHKTLGNGLREAMREGCTGADLPLHYRAQMEHQAMVSGCERILFMASQWDAEGALIEERHCWYEPDAELRARIISGWEQFEKDVAAYVPTEPAAPVVAAPMESLPAVVVQVQGALTVAGNLPAFGQALRDFIARIPAKPATDQQFADAEAACKALKKAEDALAQAEDGALAQISDVEQMRRTVADLKELARSTRLATEKLVKAEKDARRTEKVMAARAEFERHVARLQMDIKGVRLIVQMPDFGGAIKGLSSLASIDDKLTAALIAGKAEANTIAGRIAGNLQMLDSVPQYAHLFADRQDLATKDYEVLELLMQKRVDAEMARIEAERERIRQEEERKAREAAERQAEAERARIRAEEQHKAQMEAAERLKSEQEAAARQAAVAIAEQASCPDAVPGKPLAPASTAAAPVAAGIAPAAATGGADDEAPTLTIGAINERLHPISISAAGLAEFGIEPLATRKAAKLYSESQFKQACRAIVQYATNALRGELEAA